ncbi:hypothetical protein [Paenibacillus arenilitoris]|uniref:Sporulation membrane protein YtrI C-terminal domain-containing protein n=1 Tax=Paenibacillus arenilitoris TaxID=2772299 RepID=A0A927CRP2_9BACL|nr:hypothetical protein [Paenibacillus arenilitoris]MBD2872908.1 hypothetical protein [Paenibacillus arenilitoris]
MRVPPFDRYVRVMRMTGILVLGMIIGAAVYNSFYLAKTEALITLKSDLEVKLEQYEKDIKSLNEFKNQHTVIKSVKPRIEEEAGQNTGRPKLDSVTEAELIKRIRDDLGSFLGLSIYEIDSDARLARRLLERKVYSDVYGKDYRIEVKTILLAGNVMQVWVQVRYYAKPPS